MVSPEELRAHMLQWMLQDHSSKAQRYVDTLIGQVQGERKKELDNFKRELGIKPVKKNRDRGMER